MSLHLNEKELQRYLDKQTTEKETQLIEQHLAGCRNCRQELHFYREIYQALQQEPDFTLSAEFNQKVMSRLAPDNRPFIRSFYFENFLAILGILAAMVFAIQIYGLTPLFKIFSNLPPYFDHFWGMLRGISPAIPGFLKSGYALAGLTLLIVITVFENSVLKKRNHYFLL
jgi:Putative zinc-finger